MKQLSQSNAQKHPSDPSGRHLRSAFEADKRLPLSMHVLHAALCSPSATQGTVRHSMHHLLHTPYFQLWPQLPELWVRGFNI